ncbi:MAG: membrane protein insertion efficiency factor YidD [Candidatus Omnitrophica bacterium]|nr:membrane protein insertion efficiency factor YidD [Candidatus Omnitrophota bacterium]
MKGLVIFLLTLYQVSISKIMPGVCRFYPSCSEYSKQAILRYGCLRGIFLGLKRLLNCQPFSKKFGYDPLS